MPYILYYWPRVDLEAITAKYNPRRISDTTLASLVAGIKKFGIRIPCIVNTKGDKNVLVSGHQRLKAAAILNIEKLPVKLVELEPQEEKALNLALNKIEGLWDYTLLPKYLNSAIEADILELTGFSNVEMLQVLADQEEEFEETFNGFAYKGKQTKQSPFIQFNSSIIKFRCPAAEYDAMIERLKSKVGASDTDIRNHFWEKLGLNVKESVNK